MFPDFTRVRILRVSGFYAFSIQMIPVIIMRFLPSVFTFTVEFFRVLLANSTMFTRVGSTPVNHQTRLQGNVILGRVLLIFPISRQFVVAVDGDVPHAANEASLTVDSTSNHVVRSCNESIICYGLATIQNDVT